MRRTTRRPELPIVGDLTDEPELPPEDPRPIDPSELIVPTEAPLEASVPEQPAASLLPAAPAEREAMLTLPIDVGPLPSEFGVHLDTRLSVPQSTVLRRLAMALD